MSQSVDEYRSMTLARIKEFKHAAFGKTTIECSLNDFNYQLLLLTSECGNDRQLMDLIGKWRKENEIWYLSQFPVTVERTIKWFNDKLIETPDRLLFIIKTDKGYIGHLGLFRFDFNRKNCEIDNILRGEPEYPGIIGNAIINMMKWGRDYLKLGGYSLKVLSDNERAIRLYKSLCFKEIKRIPLIQVQGKDGLEWIEAPDGYDKEARKYYVVMEVI